MNSKLLSLLTIAKKAGRISLGHDIVREDLSRGKSSLILLADDCSPKSSGDIRKLSEEIGIPALTGDFTKEDTQKFFTKEYGIISVNDKGFADAALNLLEKSDRTSQKGGIL